MKRFQRIIANPIGIAFVIGHWAFAIFVFQWDFPERLGRIVSPSRSLTILHPDDTVGVDLFIILNFFSVVPVKSIFKLFSPFFDEALNVDLTAFNFFAVCSSLQWLLIGYFVSCAVDSYRKSETTKISFEK